MIAAMTRIAKRIVNRTPTGYSFLVRVKYFSQPIPTTLVFESSSRRAATAPACCHRLFAGFAWFEAGQYVQA